MTKQLMYLAIDVDDNSFTASGICEGTGETVSFKCRPVTDRLIEKLTKIKASGYELKICYESTYLGFSLARSLIAKGYFCEVIAASLIPEKSSDRVKTDRLDAENMALYYMKGLLSTVQLPDEKDEVVRQLIRLRKSVKLQISAMKNKLKSEGRIFGIEIPKTARWTQTYRGELFKLFNKIKDKNLRDLFMYYSDYIDGQHDHLLRLEKRIEEFSKDEKYKPSHDALICLRGLQTLSAMTLIAELGDINRFSHPKKLSSYIGLDIAEYSSGGKEKKLGITKTGNGRVRTCLIETQQLLLKSPTVGTVVNRRRKNADPKILAIARKCDDRIYNKARHLMMRGKHTNKIKVACARELVGFIWEIMKCSRGNQILPARSVMA